MNIEMIHSFLVHPAKGQDKQPLIRGTEVKKDVGKLLGMLQGIYFEAESECRHGIAFVSDKKGLQQNECLDDILTYVKSQTISDGRKIAERLQKVTTNKSGLGLLFMIVGREKSIRKVVISRFPAEQGVLAEESEKSLTVAFLEKVFMKSATSYKAATFSGGTPAVDFWKGKAIDKQINNPESTISNYWIRDFLRADFLTPGEQGTRRFAMALRDAINRTVDTAIKDEITAAYKLFRGFEGKVTSAKGILDQLRVSKETQEVVKNHFQKERLFDDEFRFVSQEFSKHLAFKTIELDNGGMLTAVADNFENIFERETLQHKKGVYRYITEGSIVDQRFKKVN